MDLAYGPEYQTFAAEVDAFLSTHRDRWPAVGATREQVLAWQKTLIAHGYAARTIPRAYGGYGAEPDILKSRIIAEDFTRAGAPGGHRRPGHLDAGPHSPRSRNRRAEAALDRADPAGEVIWCQGYSEPGSGSDLASLQHPRVRRTATTS